MIKELAIYYGLSPQKKKGEYKLPGEKKRIIFRERKAQIIEDIPTEGKLSKEAFTLMYFTDYLSQAGRDELVLAIDSSGVKTGETVYMSNDMDFTFLPKGFAEENGTFRQLIPYMAVMNTEAELLTYRREGDEKRLKGQRSIGVGGHVNYTDYRGDLKEAILGGLKREIKEELGIDAGAFEIKPMYLYQCDDTPVDQVHICSAFIGTLVNPPRKVPKGFKFEPIDSINPDKLEKWSKILLSEIKKMVNPPKEEENENLIDD